MKIYLARPISGRSYDEVTTYYKKLTESLQYAGYEVLCPMNGKTHLRTELEFKAHGYTNNPTSTNHAIIERDRWMVNQADVVYANLQGSTHVSIGTCMELAWAHDKGKHTIVAMEDGLSLLSETERAWLAGIIDGEGCIHIQKRGTSPSENLKNYSYQPRISIDMNCKEIIEKIVKITGLGKCNEQVRSINNKKHYLWKIVGQEASLVLKEVYNYLIEKKPMAASAIHIANRNNNRIRQTIKGQQGFSLRPEEDSIFLEEQYELWRKAMNREDIVYTNPELQYNNIHQHAFVIEAADIVFKEHYEAVNYLKNLLVPIQQEDKQIKINYEIQV